MHEKLVVWREAYTLCLWIYSITKNFPKEERYGLTSQMRRSSMSVPTNIAEGNMKRSNKEKGHFFETASASLEELHVETSLAKDLAYINESDFQDTVDRIQRVSFLLMKLRGSLQ